VLAHLSVPTGDHNVHAEEGTPRTLCAVAKVAALALSLLLCALAAAGAAGAQPTVGGVYPALRDPGQLAFPTAAAVDAARHYVKRRRGRVSFAVADLRGGIAGYRVNRTYRAASLSKAMLFVAYLRKLAREHRGPDASEGFALDAMIRVSDNDSATALYRRLGPRPLRALARRAHMRRFAVGGEWSEARVTAADQARFFLRLGHLLPRGRRDFALSLLSAVQQDWGVPAAARPMGWKVFFKGGWRPRGGGQIVHQAALLKRGARKIAVAVLSDSDPSEDYGHRTIAGVTHALLSRARPKPYPGVSLPRVPPLRPLSQQLASG
jgi:beta-lactamase class A